MAPRGHTGETAVGRLWPGRALLFVFVVVSINGLFSIVAPALWLAGAIDVSEPQRRHVAAVWAIASLGVQLTALWVIIGYRVRELVSLWLTRRRVDRILRSGPLTMAFQPIVNHKTDSVIGVEALARFPEAPHRTPDVWFADADRVGRGPELELHAIRSALACVGQLPVNAYVSLNVSPATLADERLISVLTATGVPLDRLVLEITEHCFIPDYSTLSRVRSQLSERHIGLAVDDAGSGYASFRNIVTLSPDIIKLDRALVRGLHQDDARQALTRAIVAFAATIGATVIGEGVETLEELKALESSGVETVQGFFIARPTTDPAQWSRRPALADVPSSPHRLHIRAADG